MELAALEYKLLPKLASLASSLALEGVYPLAHLEKGARCFTLSEGIRYNLRLTNTGGAVLLGGTAEACLSGICDRCLGPTEFTVVGEVQGYLVINAGDDGAAAVEQLQTAEAEFGYLDKDGSVDLAPYLAAALVFELPEMVLCDSSCAGLCAHCGANLNQEPCSCPAQQGAEDHPFAVLRDLL